MTDTAKKHTHAIVIPPIERNGVSKVLSKLAFGKKHKSYGLEYWGPEFSMASMADDLTWIGADWVLSVLGRRARLDFAEIFTNLYYEDDGKTPRTVFPLEEYIKDMTEFTEGEAKLASLREDMDELRDIQEGLVYQAMVDPENQEQFLDEVKKNNPAILELKKKIAVLENKYQARAAKREAARKAKEEAAKLAGATTAAAAA